MYAGGDIIDAFNKRVIRTGISPTLTTRPEGFKTGILVVVDDKGSLCINSETN